MSLADPLAESWEETIAALPSAAERAEATAFIQNDLRQGVGVGLLRGWFLLMKANRLFMESMPARLRKEFSQEIMEEIVRLGKSLAAHDKNWKEGVSSLERSATHAENAAQRIEKIVPHTDKIVQDAFDRIDTTKLSGAISQTVMKSTVEPVTKTNEELKSTSELLRELVLHTNAAIKALSLLSLPGIAGVVFLAALLLCGSVAAIVVGRIHAGYDRELALAVETNGPAFAQLSRLHAKLEIAPQGDTQGNPIPGCWALSVDAAEEAQMKTNDPRRRGVIFFKEGDF